MPPPSPSPGPGQAQRYRAAARPVPPPAEAVPPLSCDCHFHVHGDPRRFPYPHGRQGSFVGMATVDDLLGVHRALGIQRGVLVQPSGYRGDHSYLLEALARVPRGQYRATALIDETTSDAELQRLHDAGVRGTRLVLQHWAEPPPSPAGLRRIVERIRPLGWYLKVYLGPEEVGTYAEALKAVAPVPLVLDHLCRLRLVDGAPHAAMATVSELLKRDNVWMILSNGYHFSAEKTGWSDIAGLARRLFECAPERCLWGSDWPHPRDQNLGHGPEEAEILALLYRILPDAAARRAVLVDNPARLHDFTAPP